MSQIAVAHKTANMWLCALGLFECLATLKNYSKSGLQGLNQQEKSFNNIAKKWESPIYFRGQE